MYRDIHTLQPYIIDFTQRGCHTLRYVWILVRRLLLSGGVLVCVATLSSQASLG